MFRKTDTVTWQQLTLNSHGNFYASSEVSAFILSSNFFKLSRLTLDTATMDRH
jgi:hypothetical protein